MTIIRRPPGGARRFGGAPEWFADDPWRAFDRWFSGGEVGANAGPAMDVRESGDSYVVEVEMPGVRPEDAEVTLDGRTLVVRGSYEEREDEREGQWLLRERRTGGFARAITLPNQVDAEAIECTFDNGELRVTLPKARETRARRIEIGGTRAGGGSARTSAGAGTAGTMPEGTRRLEGEAQPI